MIEKLAITASSALISLILLYPLYQLLHRGFVHSFREWGPQHHLEKQSVPTAGGLVFLLMLLLSSAVGVFLLGDFVGFGRDALFQAAFILLVTLAFAILGFIDDYLKAKLHSSRGFLARYKLALQIIFAAGALYYMHGTAATIFVPFHSETITLAPWPYYLVGIMLLVGLVNAVNFTDGLDGLASGMAALSLGANAVLFDAARNNMLANGDLLSFLSLVMAGAAIAFLVVNFKPAQIYMGDTGSYFLGAFIGLTAIAGGFMLYLIPLAVVYGMELLSVILQVAYFRLTKGKRLFKMSPLHHHFELSGVGEIGVVTLFWIMQAAVCICGVAMYLLSRI